MTLTSDYQYIGRTSGVKARAQEWLYYVLVYAKTAGDVATGKHTVSVKMRLVCDRNSSFYGYSSAGSAAVDGAQAISFNAVNPSSAWQDNLTEGGVTYPKWVDLAEGSVTVDTGWGADKTVTLTAAWQRLASTTTPPTYVPGTTAISGSFAVTLPMLAGASKPTLSAASTEMGKALTIYTNPLSTGFTHRLTYAFGNATGVISQNAAASASWTPPLELAKQISANVTGYGSIYCTTYQNGVQVGSVQSVPLTLTVPASVSPTATMTWSDTSGAYGKFGRLLQNVSCLAVDVNGTGAYGSTIRSVALSVDGASYAGGVLTRSGNQILKAVVTDSRGRTGQVQQTISVTAYSVPTVKVQASRTPDDTGEQAVVTITGSVCDMPGNSARLTFTHGDTTEEIPVEVGCFTHSLTLDAPSVSTLSLKAELSDAICTATDEMTLSVGYATMDFLKGGRGIAFGATATREGFTCAMDAEFLGKVRGTIFDAIYPVGSIYMSMNGTDPGQLFGGTWERIQDRFLLAAGAYAAGSLGGQASHFHRLPLYSAANAGMALLDTSKFNQGKDFTYSTAADNWFFGSSGGVGSLSPGYQFGTTTANNLPPYLAVYIWKRSA